MICIFYGIMLLWMLEVGAVKYHFYLIPDIHFPKPGVLGECPFPAVTLLLGNCSFFFTEK